MADGIERSLDKLHVSGPTPSTQRDRTGEPEFTHARLVDAPRLSSTAASTPRSTSTSTSGAPGQAWTPRARLEMQVGKDLARAAYPVSTSFLVDSLPEMSSAEMEEAFLLRGVNSDIVAQSLGNRTASIINVALAEARSNPLAIPNFERLDRVVLAIAQWPREVRYHASFWAVYHLGCEGLSAPLLMAVCDRMLALDVPQPAISLEQLSLALDYRKDEENQALISAFLRQTQVRNRSGHAIALLGLSYAIPLVASDEPPARTMTFDFGPLLDTLSGEARSAMQARLEATAAAMQPAPTADVARRMELLRSIVNLVPDSSGSVAEHEQRKFLLDFLLQATISYFKGREKLLAFDLILSSECEEAASMDALIEELSGWEDPGNDDAKRKAVIDYLSNFEGSSLITRPVLLVTGFIAAITSALCGHGAPPMGASDLPIGRKQAIEKLCLSMLAAAIHYLGEVPFPDRDVVLDNVQQNAVPAFLDMRAKAQAVIDQARDVDFEGFT